MANHLASSDPQPIRPGPNGERVPRETGGGNRGRFVRRPWLAVVIAAVACGCVVAVTVVVNSGHRAPKHRSAPRSATTGSNGTQRATTPTTTGGTSTLPAASSSWATGGPGLEPAVTPRAVPDQALDNILAKQLGPGWVGGDDTYSTRLPDGREAFVFADTLIGTAQPDGTASFTGMAHSSELVGVLPDLVPDYGGTYSAPQNLIPDTYNSEGIWEPFATYTQGDDQMIFVNEFAGPPGILTLRYTGRSGIAVLSVAPRHLPTLSSVILLPPDLDTQWGSAVMESGGYLYVYGSVLDRAQQYSVHDVKVARVPVGQSLDFSAWTYWNGSQWTAGESNAAPVLTVNGLTGVEPDPDGKGFVAVSVPSGIFSDTTVDLSYASSPAGPWTTPQPVYVIPEITEYSGEMAYFPTFHPELSSGGQLVVSYNIDTTVGFSVLSHDIHSYQPQFLTISG